MNVTLKAGYLKGQVASREKELSLDTSVKAIPSWTFVQAASSLFIPSFLRVPADKYCRLHVSP
ncbi:MAG TPA: hypothetical protein VLX12_07595, partial [Syntrophorhabdales bacterium]|nr:hypothetical protein [Syntrophorhabdales bacterium]